MKPQVCRHQVTQRRPRVKTAGETESPPRETQLPLSRKGHEDTPTPRGGEDKRSRGPESGQVCSSHRPRCIYWCPPGDRGEPWGAGSPSVSAIHKDLPNPQSPDCSSPDGPHSLAGPRPAGVAVPCERLGNRHPPQSPLPGDTDVTSRRDGSSGARRRPGLPPRFVRLEPN